MSEPTQGKASKFFNLTLPKRVVWAIWGIFIFTGFNFFRGCNTNKEDSRNRKEYRYTIDMTKWSGEKNLQFVAIVENNHIKTGFFNWV